MNARPSALSSCAVELDAAAQAAWCSAAASASNCRADELRIEFAARPPFLLPGCLLLQLHYTARVPAEQASWWWAGETEAISDLTLWCVVGGAEENDRWVHALGATKDLDQALRERPVFRIDAETAADYLRVLADFARPEDSRLADKPLLIERVDEIRFWTPLNSLEHSTLSECLRNSPLCTAEPIKHGFAITGTALLEDQLWRVRYRIYDRDVEGLGERPAQKGEIHVSLVDDAPLLAGLPGNYLRALGGRPTDTSARLGYQPDRDGRTRLALPEAKAVLRDVNRRILPILGRDSGTQVYRKPLPFYGLDLVEIRDCLQSGQRCVRFVVWAPGFAASLGTSSEWIHKLNEHLRIHRRWSLQSPDDAAGYLHFFSAFIWGDDGPFRIVTNADEVPDIADLPRVHVHADAHKVLGLDLPLAPADVLAQIRAPQVRGRDDDGDFRVVATLFYKGSLFRAEYKVGATGTVQMVDNDPLLHWENWDRDTWKPRVPAAALDAPIGLDDEPKLELATAADCAAEIRAARDAGGSRPVEISGRTICGRLDLRGETIGPLTLSNCRFRGPVQLGHGNCSGDVNIRNCVFESGLGLAEATIRGRLHMDGVVICGRTQLSRQDALEHENGAALALSETSARNITLAQVSLNGTLLAQNLQVHGNVELLSVQSLASIVLMSASIGHRLLISTVTRSLRGCMHGYLDLEFVKAQSIMLRGIDVISHLYLRYACAEQLIDLQGVRFPAGGEGEADYVMPLSVGYYPAVGGGRTEFAGDLSLYGTVVEKNQLSIQNVDVAGNLEAEFVRVGTGIWIEPDMTGPGRNRICGDLELGGASIPQILRIRRTDIGGDLTGRGLHTGEIRAVGEVALVKGEDEAPPAPSYQPLVVGGEVSLQDAWVGGEVYIAGVRAGQSLNLRRATIGGDVTLSINCKEAKGRGLAQVGDADEGQLLAEFPAGINLRKTAVSGDVVLSGVQCVDGLIDMADSHVQRDIEILVDPGRAHTRALRLAGLRCDGNVDISGLSLARGCDENACRGPRCELPGCEIRHATGHVIAQGAQVAGLLRAASDSHSAKIPGCLDLAFSQVGTLEISVETFPLENACTQGAEACGVILQRSSIGMLTVHANKQGYPRPLDLRYAEIKWWEFNHRDAPGTDAVRRSSDNPRDYIALLVGDRGLQRHTWRAIENNLYNWGHETAADDIHREMRRWLRQRVREEGPAPGFWNRVGWYPRRMFRRVGDWLTDGVTSPMRMLRLMGLWLVVSTYLFSVPANIGLSEEGFLTLPNEIRYELQHPAARTWGPAAGFWMALRFHVPVAAFTARDEWEPANDRPMMIYQNLNLPVRIDAGITAEDYANLVLITHWIAWPVIIVLASRRFLRRAQQP